MQKTLAIVLVTLCSLSGAPLARALELDPAAVRAADAYAASRNGLSLLVVKDDRIVYEAYHNGFSPGYITSIFSGTKGFWCVAAAIAEQEGILDLDEPAARTLPEWEGSPVKSQIRIRDLLSFTAGLEPVFALHGRSIPDRDAYSVRLPPVCRPGEAFMYGPSQLQVFLEVFKRKLALRHTTPEEYLTRHLLWPLGIRSVDFRKDAAGNPLLASGFKLTARQWAQFGRLILAGGRYHGRQLVHLQDLEECFHGTKANPIFGMGFWLNRYADDPDAREVDVEKVLEQPWQRQAWQHACLSHVAPSDMVAAIGSGYQRMFLIPSENLIVIRQGRNADFSDAHFLRLLFAGSTPSPSLAAKAIRTRAE
ncbi:MAG: beta-lactamase family protein [Verrucomicrobia bacterium]|nr:beta-lactamase family protein [Verrucomicrobiota bacterium]